jgi:N utilization substance protein A
MSYQILAALDYMEKEKGIPRGEMVRTISDAIVYAAQRGVNAGQRLEVSINPRTGALTAWALLTVVDSVGDSQREIHIQLAQQENSAAQLGDTIRRPIEPALLGRIAAQAAREAILQGMRAHERNRLMGRYERQIGKVVGGTIVRREIFDSRIAGGAPLVNYILDVNGDEGVLAQRDTIPGEELHVGDSVRALLLNIHSHNMGTSLVLSRTMPRFVEALLQLEIAELADGTVEIVRLVREPGYRTKIAVRSKDSHVDAVGACVGERGVRIKGIIRELGGEKIDVMRYSDDLVKFFKEVLKPAVAQNIRIEEAEQRIGFEVPTADLALVIGKGGKNARLMSRLLNCRLDISAPDSGRARFDKDRQRAVEDLNAQIGLSHEYAAKLIDIGITTAEALQGVTVADLVDAGLTQADAVLVIDAYKQRRREESAAATGAG